MRELFLQDIDAWMRWIEFLGKEPARVFIHGLGGAGAADFAHIAAHPRLAGQRSVLVDLLGFAFSDRPREFSYSIRDHATTVAAVLDHLGLRATQVIGHSMGGTIAVVLAHTRPDLVSQLVVCEPNLLPGGGSSSRAIASYGEDEFVRSGYEVRLRAEHDQSPSYAACLRLADPLAVHRSATSLVELTTPPPIEMLNDLRIARTFILGGRNRSDADAQAAAAIDIPVREVPDAGHNMTLDNPDGFAAALAAALDTGASMK
jgi:pimeloyl-ACP methyl ester carboxylesterase